MDYIKLLLDIGELDWVFKGANTIETLLNNIVELIARRMKANICSIYLYEEEKKELVLRANVGFDAGLIGKIRLKLGEGIAGTSLGLNEPICTIDGFSHPNFKYFKGTHEELYKSFLSVPIVNGSSKIGVLMLQRTEENRFEENDLLAVKIIASQLASLIENARFMMSFNRTGAAREIKTAKPVFEFKFLKGRTASRGYAYGPAAVVTKEAGFSRIEKLEFSRRYTLKDFYAAVDATENQLETMQKKVGDQLSDAASMIFTSHIMIIKDKSVLSSIEALIAKGVNPPAAVITVGKKYRDMFLNGADEYMKEKAQDIEDLVTRIVSNLVKKEIKLPGVKRSVVVASEMYPSDILTLSTQNIRGIILNSGGVTSHVAILARSLQIPLVIVNEPGIVNIEPGTKVLVDAELGNVFINPEKFVVDEYKDKIKQLAVSSASIKMEPVTKTKDGVRINLLANVNLLKDLDFIKKLACDGIGLYRSEFPFIIRRNFPSEEEQYFVYRKLVEGSPKKEITFRTLDIGGDKALPYYQSAKKENPFLGMRSIRFSLKRKDIFSQQIKAVLRAGVDANLKIMFPMVYSIEEFEKAKNIVLEGIDSLRAAKVPATPRPR